MLKKETVKVAVTVIAGFGLALLLVGTSPSFHSCIQEHQQHATEGTSQEHIGGLLVFYKIGRGCGGEWLHEHGEAVIALFTVILGIATWLLWRSTRALVEGAEKTAERQLRAYVFVKGGGIVLHNSQKIQAQVQLLKPHYPVRRESGSAPSWLR